MANRFKEIPQTEVNEQVSEAPVAKPQAQNVRFRVPLIGDLLKGEILSDEKTLQKIPFLSFLAFLSVIYIYNAYTVERSMVEINKLNKRVKDLHSKYVSIKSELMYASQQSEIAIVLSEQGIQESTVPPKVIKINDPEYVNIY